MVEEMGQDEGEARLTFGVALRRKRTSCGISLTELARLANYSKGYLSKIETGDKPVTYEIAQACDVALGAGGQLVELARGHHREPFPMRPSQLPAEVAGFVGRDSEIKSLTSFLEAGSGVVAISGAPGVGKTALALHWAHSIRDRFPGGSLFANLRGYDPHNKPVSPMEVLDSFLRALNVPIEIIPNTLEDRAALLRTRLDQRRVLVVLDNAISADQMRSLLPSSPDCLVIVTSRGLLSGLIAREGAQRLILEPLSREEAIALLRCRIGGDRAAGEPMAMEALASHCAYLPLALRVASERVGRRPQLHLADLVRDLADERDRLNVLSPGDDETTAVRTVFSWSYRSLSPEAARLFRMLGLHAGTEVSAGCAAALCGIEPREVGRWLDVLTGVHLLSEVGPGRFRFHDLLRLYAREQACAQESKSARDSAVRRMVIWYLRCAVEANRILAPGWHPTLIEETYDEVYLDGFPSYRDALNWCETECDNVVAATRQAYEYGFDDLAWKLPVVDWDFFHLRKRWTPWIEAHEIALQASRRIGDLRGEGWVRFNLGAAYCDLRRFTEAFDHYRSSFSLRDQMGDEWGKAWTRYALGIALQAVGLQDEAADHYHHAVAFFEGSGDLLGQALCLAGLADVRRARSEFGPALEHLGRSVALFRELGDRHGEGYVATKLGATLREAGQADEALEYFCQSVTISRQAGDRQGEALALDNLAQIRNDLGQRAEAHRCWIQAVEILEKLGDPRAEDVRARLVTATGDNQTGPT